MTRITRFALPLALLAVLAFGTGQTALANHHHHYHRGAKMGNFGGYGFGGYRGVGYPYGSGYRGFGGYPAFGYGYRGVGYGYGIFPNYSYGYVPAFGGGMFSSPNYGAWGGFNVW